MTRLLAALAVRLAACVPGPTSPVPSPAPPAEIAVLQSENGAYSIVEVRTGSRLAALPAGILALGLSGGQDIAEGYLVTPSADGGSAVEVLVPSRSLALDPLATQSGEAVAAVLAGARWPFPTASSGGWPARPRPESARRRLVGATGGVARRLSPLRGDAVRGGAG
jgi:hypothetical protein